MIFTALRRNNFIKNQTYLTHLFALLNLQATNTVRHERITKIARNMDL